MISGITHRTIQAPDGAAAVVLTPRGELDLASIAALDAAARSALAAAPRPPRFVVDLSEVSLLAPVVAGVLLDVRRRCRRAGGALALVIAAADIAAALEDLEIACLFAVAPDLAGAVARLAAQAHAPTPTAPLSIARRCPPR